MTPLHKQRAKSLAETLREAKAKSGFVVKDGHVLLRGPGAVFTDLSAQFFVEDLRNAVSLGLIVKGSVVGKRSSWDWYVLSKKESRSLG